MKKRFSILSIFLFLLIIAGVFFFAKNEYGTDYSEQQRQLWNERLSLHIYGKYFGGAMDYRELDKDKELASIISGKQRDEAPEWDLSVNMPQDVSSLPCSALTEEELITRAQDHDDTDACLALAGRFLAYDVMYVVSDRAYNERGPRSRKIESPIRILLYKQAMKWLQTASERGKPGVDALIQLATNRLIYCKRNQKGWGYYPEESDLKNIPGYNQLANAILSGDMLSWQILHEEFMSNRDYTLNGFVKEFLNQGHIPDSKRILAHLNAQTSLGYNVYEEKSRPRHALIVWMSKQLEPWAYIRRTIDKSPTLEHVANNVDQLRQLGAAGDLEAKALWMLHQNYQIKFFDQILWTNTFLFADQLINAGHAPYMEQLFSSRFHSTPNKIILSFYSPASLERVRNEAMKSLMQRGSLSALCHSVKINIEQGWHEENRENNLFLLRKLYGVFPGYFAIDEVYTSILSPSSDPVIRQELMAYLRELSAKGDEPEKSAWKHAQKLYSLSQGEDNSNDERSR